MTYNQPAFSFSGSISSGKIGGSFCPTTKAEGSLAMIAPALAFADAIERLTYIVDGRSGRSRHRKCPRTHVRPLIGLPTISLPNTFGSIFRQNPSTSTLYRGGEYARTMVGLPRSITFSEATVLKRGRFSDATFDIFVAAF